MAKVIFTESQLAELKQMMDNGIRQTNIAKHFKVTDDTIRRICREAGFEIKMPYKCTCIICNEVFYSNIKNGKHVRRNIIELA